VRKQSFALNNKGFSLIEILIVLALVGGIVALIASRVGGAQQNANKKQTEIIMRAVMDQLELFNNDCGSYPTTEQGLTALVKKPSGDPGCESWGPAPYAKEEPKDAWKNKFGYESDGTDFEITSFGKNKRPGGEGIDADISSKNMK
jgi:general secretion pathway protein G